MNKKPLLKLSLLLLLPFSILAQKASTPQFTKADTLRGSITPERAWWNLLHYDIQVRPNLVDKTIQGTVAIQFKVLTKGKRMQIDLQQPLIIDSVIYSGKTKQILSFTREGNAAMVNMPNDLKVNTEGLVQVHYHGVPRAAIRAPWDGGISWTKDELGNPFVATSCQGLGASVWWPCKDHQYDEPEKGVTISVRVPDTLMNVSNGRLVNTIQHNDATKSWVWQVTEPINNYSVSMNIGKYIHMQDDFNGEAGKLSLDYYVLPQNKQGAERQFAQVKPMLECFEYWFGKYPFYKDGFKLVEVPYLGMEHQSNVAYGNKYMNGYLGRDLSGTGWGLKWDFIVVHESGHEWFGNNITSKDIADMWIHEGFTNYSETLFTQWLSGKEAGSAYNKGARKNIRNDKPILGTYNVHNTGSGDMYPKASAMLHSIRMSMNNDDKFRQLLRHLNKKFYHQIVTTPMIEKEISLFAGYSVKSIFTQYLTTTQVPSFDYKLSSDGRTLSYRYSNAVNNFYMPLQVKTNNGYLILKPQVNTWQTVRLTNAQAYNLQLENLENYFYISINGRKEVQIKMN
ncbi:MAG: M1 family metallopeptidase [Sediminibacterium sp.]|uniref:M1 family metallopeptidase n=1 Tax=Sediminibacterium sp. TaxID=1917865 RepID=UPI0027228279|nr:M1 family metallopeptidase [Sediminibacterium sp.]MDO8995460.1 M1 family metallopeptidase [Sediminibacterium sp.]